MALTVVRAGPTVRCSSTAASAILRRVSCIRSALRFISYFRGIGEIIAQLCVFNLDEGIIPCHCSLHSVVYRKEKAVVSSQEQASKEVLTNAEADVEGRSRTSREKARRCGGLGCWPPSRPQLSRP